MKADRRYRAMIALFGIVLLCTAVSASRWIVSHGIPWWAICCRMLAKPMDGGPSFSWVPPSLQGGLLVLSIYGVSNLIWRLWRTHRFVSELKAASIAWPPTRLALLLNDLELSSHVVVVNTDVPFALTIGLFRPHVCLSTGMIDILTDKQLEAVLLHEDHHRRRYDPLRTLIAEWIGAILFFLPAVVELRDLFLTQIELEADRHAVQFTGRPALAGALYEILSHPLALHLQKPVGINRINAVDARITQLVDNSSTPLHISIRSLWMSSAMLMLVCIVA